MDVRIALEPANPSGPGGGTYAESRQPEVYARRRNAVVQAVEAAGATVVPPEDANAVAWLTQASVKPLLALLDAHPGIRWAQLPWAGIDAFVASGLLERDATFTCAKGAYDRQIAEHALMLLLAAQRNVVQQARAGQWTPGEPQSLAGSRVTVVGGGGIAARLVEYLAVMGAEATVVRRSPETVPGAVRTLGSDRLHDVLPETDALVLALALTPETRGLIGADELALLPAHAVLVNIARGAHINTDALVDALQSGRLAAAGLDVTDPEPLPAGHPLWGLDNVLITSHSANSSSYVTDKLTERIVDNVRRYAAREPLAGVVDPEAGY